MKMPVAYNIKINKGDKSKQKTSIRSIRDYYVFLLFFFFIIYSLMIFFINVSAKSRFIFFEFFFEGSITPDIILVSGPYL